MAELSVMPEARQIFIQYIESNPRSLAHETEASGVDPLTQTDAYFAQELREPEHSDILSMVNANGGLMTAPMMERWINENSREFPPTGMSQEEKLRPMFDEMEVRINRSILYDLATDGIIASEARALEGPCECFELPSGKRYCWDKGIIGALDQEQIARFCPPSNSVTRSGGEIPSHVQEFIEASEACEIGKTADGMQVTNLQTRLECMSKEASKRGIEI